MNTKKDPSIHQLCDFLDASPTAWHAVRNAARFLKETHNFTELHEGESWKLEPGKAYYVIRNGSSLCAFITPKASPKKAHVIGTHTDSPALKLKPKSEFRIENMTMLGVEVYGGPLLTSWLNRDLGIAGRVFYTDKSGAVKEALIDLNEHPVVIPQLAIHLEPKDKPLELNKQQHLSALAGINIKESTSYLESAIKKAVSDLEAILGTDLFLYPLEKARLVGNENQLISSYRYDNLGSTYAAIEGLVNALTPSKDTLKMIVLWDNEEIGSDTAQGASSPFFENTLERVLLALGGTREDHLRVLSQSICISADQAHALHPNHPEKHDTQHQPLMGEGIVIKYNAQQRYATDARSAALVMDLCKKNKIPFQQFVSRNDMACGSTIGPIQATKTGIATVDIGTPQLSMHSSRELAATSDHLAMVKLLTLFLS